jgi:Tfp pilus assembly protein PilF
VALNEPGEAVGPLRKSAEADPDFDQAHFVLGNALRKLGQPKDAAREFQICKQIKARKNVQEKPSD